ncbi:MAG: hypothetical protein Q9169_005982 [Polycauliona sp. 2 TL-2023]
MEGPSNRSFLPGQKNKRLLTDVITCINALRTEVDVFKNSVARELADLIEQVRILSQQRTTCTRCQDSSKVPITDRSHTETPRLDQSDSFGLPSTALSKTSEHLTIRDPRRRSSIDRLVDELLDDGDLPAQQSVPQRSNALQWNDLGQRQAEISGVKKVKGKQCSMVFDVGIECSLISGDLANQIPALRTMLKAPIRITLSQLCKNDGIQKGIVSKRADLHITPIGSKVTWSFSAYVFEEMLSGVVLGKDFIKQHLGISVTGGTLRSMPTTTINSKAVLPRATTSQAIGAGPLRSKSKKRSVSFAPEVAKEDGKVKQEIKEEAADGDEAVVGAYAASPVNPPLRMGVSKPPIRPRRGGLRF